MTMKMKVKLPTRSARQLRCCRRRLRAGRSDDCGPPSAAAPGEEEDDDDVDSYSVVEQEGDDDSIENSEGSGSAVGDGEALGEDRGPSDRDESRNEPRSGPLRLDSALIEGGGLHLADPDGQSEMDEEESSLLDQDDYVNSYILSRHGHSGHGGSYDEASLPDRDVDQDDQEVEAAGELRRLRLRLAQSEERNKDLEQDLANARREAERDAALQFVEEKERLKFEWEEERDNSLRQLQEENDRLQRELEEATRSAEENSESQTLLRKAHKEHRKLANENERLKGELETSTTENQALAQTNEQSAADNERLQLELDQSKSNAQTLLEELNAARSQCEAMPYFETRVKELLEELERRDLEVRCLKEELDEVKGLYRREQVRSTTSAATSSVSVYDTASSAGSAPSSSSADESPPVDGKDAPSGDGAISTTSRPLSPKNIVAGWTGMKHQSAPKAAAPAADVATDGGADGGGSESTAHRSSIGGSIGNSIGGSIGNSIGGSIGGWGMSVGSVRGLKASIVKGMKENYDKQPHKRQSQPKSHAEAIKALQEMDRQRSNRRQSVGDGRGEASGVAPRSPPPDQKIMDIAVTIENGSGLKGGANGEKKDGGSPAASATPKSPLALGRGDSGVSAADSEGYGEFLRWVRSEEGGDKGSPMTGGEGATTATAC